jgi:predicted unusual protein kinase regulating ubiquinone biosynthesis (AarF/ABC1/UbiB family)
MQGTPLSKIIAKGEKSERDHAGLLLAEFALSAPERVGYLHCDPHPGNFQLLPDGRLGVIDFGASIKLPGGIPSFIGTLARHCIDENYDELVTTLRENGFVRGNARIDIGPLERTIHPIVAEIDGENLHISRKLLQDYTMRALDVKNMSATNAVAIKAPKDSPELVMLGRVFSGVVGICAQLDAEGPFIDLFQRWLPGFAEAGEAA